MAIVVEKVRGIRKNMYGFTTEQMSVAFTSDEVGESLSITSQGVEYRVSYNQIERIINKARNLNKLDSGK